MREYIKITAISINGDIRYHKLKSSEFHLLRNIARDNKQVTFSLEKMTKKEYELTFNA